MKVCIFHPVVLPPRDYGGIERVVLWLTQGLLELGHEVWVGALEGSQLPRGAKLIEFSSDDRSAETLLRKLPPGIDVVHFMAPPEDGVMKRLPCSSLFTLHGNGKADETFPKNTVFLSQDHARRHGGDFFVYNGIDPSEYLFDPSQKDSRFLFLSKTSWSVKNLLGATRYCREARQPLVIAGGSRPLGIRFRSYLDPLLSWEGPVSGQKKAELLARASALVFPVLWPEPFGLVMVEALISGTPVIGAARGSVPELIPESVGLVLKNRSAEDDSAWVEALAQGAERWDPEACRDWAMKRFHYRQMAENYVKAYRRIAQNESLHSERPRTLTDWRKLN